MKKAVPINKEANQRIVGIKIWKRTTPINATYCRCQSKNPIKYGISLWEEDWRLTQSTGQGRIVKQQPLVRMMISKIIATTNQRWWLDSYNQKQGKVQSGHHLLSYHLYDRISCPERKEREAADSPQYVESHRHGR